MTLEKRLEIAEKSLKSCEAANEYLKKELDNAEHEIKLAKKEIVDICTRHNIRYYMDEHNRLWEMQDKTDAERVHAAQEDSDADPNL